MRWLSWRRSRNFNSRPCVRGDLLVYHRFGGILKFQFTPLREGRRLAAICNVAKGFYFNSRPCVRGDSPGY